MIKITFLLYLIGLIIFAFGFHNVNAFQSIAISPDTSTCQYQRSYNSTTEIFQCAPIPSQSGSSSDFPMQPYSYVIFKNNTGTYALNGNTGKIDYSDKDPTTVIQSAYNNISNGGTLRILKGTYNLSQQLVFNKTNTGVSCEDGTVLQPISGFMGGSLILITGGNNPANFHFYELNTNVSDVLGVSGIKIQNLDQADISTNIIYVNTGSVIIFDSTDGNSILDNTVKFNIATGSGSMTGSKGIDIESNSTTAGVQQGNNIQWNFIDNVRYGIFFNDYSNPRFTLNSFNGIAIDTLGVHNSWAIFVAGNTITQNVFNIPNFLAGSSGAIGGTQKVARAATFANINQSVFNVGLVQNKWFVYGSGNEITVFGTHSNSMNTPVQLSQTQGIKYYGGIKSYVDKIYASCLLPYLPAGGTATFYFYDSLLDGYDGVETSLVNQDGSAPVTIYATDNSLVNSGEGKITFITPIAIQSQTVDVMINIGK